ncbi:ABC transporter substrate-binding protein [Arthrobacter sp. B2a2-09]|uniref:ABC transporter substrate-binding protein n=1 Tax=Arthrobacter sp. B2a2-09 TaxID=2952822 RepID=UPI0022CD249C|nr:ABC transporter substrate-binding protein [Arthrobacter sp. B2a2-09]MCZ9880231.1 ABC transporter substrate-binding protein [Arthrobacter sp. B2a2-09]
MINIRRTAAAGTISLALALAGTACSSAAGSAPATTSADGTTSLTVTLAPIPDSAPLYIAVEQGIFKKHGLDVKISPAPTMGASIPALVSGAAQIGVLANVDAMQASAAGVPLRLFGATTVTTDKPAEDTGKVYVAKDSPIKQLSDLAGKTIGVSGLGGAGELSLRVALDKSGVDSSHVKFLEVPLDSMLNSLERGQVDAINTISPFTNAAEASGAHYILSPGAVAVPHALQFVMATTAQFLDVNKAVVENFKAAVDEATAYAAKNPNAVRAILPNYSGTPKELAAVMQLPEFNSDFTKDRARIWSDLIAKYGFVKGTIDIDTLIVQNG